MKKLLFVYLLLNNLLISFPISVFAIEPIHNATEGLHYEYAPSEGSIEELYKDIIVTLLEPVITNEVTIHYGKPLLYDLFDIAFLNIERPSYRSFTFVIRLKIRPFVGAHNTIGIDEITIRVSPGETKVEEFKHIESFPMPPNLKEDYKDLKL